MLDEALAEADPARTIRATDVDHDGDLDLLTEAGLFTANGDGSWRRQMEGLEALSSDAASVLPMDLDQDRDRDLVVVGQQGLWVIRNDRIWQWESLQIDDEPAQAVVGATQTPMGWLICTFCGPRLWIISRSDDLSLVRKHQTELKGMHSMMLADFSGMDVWNCSVPETVPLSCIPLTMPRRWKRRWMHSRTRVRRCVP